VTSVLSADLQQLFDRAFAPLEAAVAAKRIPGGVLGIVDSNGHRIVRAIGSAQLVPKQRPMTVETWFDLASLTKVIFTTPRILALAEDGVIDLDVPVRTYVPELRLPDPVIAERVTIRDLLSHRSGLDRHDHAWILNPSWSREASSRASSSAATRSRC